MLSSLKNTQQSLLLIKTIEMACKCQKESILAIHVQDPEGQGLHFQKAEFPLLASSSSQKGTKENNKLVNKMNPSKDNEKRENVAKLKNKMKYICVSQAAPERQMGHAGAHMPVLATAAMLSTQWESWRIWNPFAHYDNWQIEP